MTALGERNGNGGIPSRPSHSTNIVPTVYGGSTVDLDDPADLYHESSKLYPSFGGRQTRGYVLEQSEELRQSTLRAVKRHDHLPAVSLPETALPDAALGDVIRGRRSARGFGNAPLTRDDLAALLDAAYGITHQLDPAAPPGTSPFLRAAPSGGALYPLDLWVFAFSVHELEPGLYHFDPTRRRLEELRLGELRGAVADAAIYPDLVAGCGAFITVSAMFWRTRFKYGLRGYRFALLEAGHVMQNLLLTATALGLASVPVGGFYDRRMDDLLDLDGVNESVVYAAAVGPSGDGP